MFCQSHLVYTLLNEDSESNTWSAGNTGQNVNDLRRGKKGEKPAN